MQNDMKQNSYENSYENSYVIFFLTLSNGSNKQFEISGNFGGSGLQG